MAIGDITPIDADVIIAGIRGDVKMIRKDGSPTFYAVQCDTANLTTLASASVDAAGNIVMNGTSDIANRQGTAGFRAWVNGDIFVFGAADPGYANEMVHTYSITDAGVITALIDDQVVRAASSFRSTLSSHSYRLTNSYLLVYSDSTTPAYRIQTVQVSDAGAIIGLIDTATWANAGVGVDQRCSLRWLYGTIYGVAYASSTRTLRLRTFNVTEWGIITFIADIELDPAIAGVLNAYVPTMCPLRHPLRFACASRRDSDANIVLYTFEITTAGVPSLIESLVIAPCVGTSGYDIGMEYVTHDIVVMKWYDSDGAGTSDGWRSIQIDSHGHIGAILFTQTISAPATRHYGYYIEKHINNIYIEGRARLPVDGGNPHLVTFSVEEDPIVAATVTTLPATGINYHLGTLNGILTADGGDALVCGFNWGPTPALGNTVTLPGFFLTGDALTANLTGLASSTTYWFQAFATGTLGTVTGAILSFTTFNHGPGPAPPAPGIGIQVLTLPATNIY